MAQLLIDLVNNAGAMGNSIAPQSIAGVVTGTALDLSNAEVATNAVIDVGTLGTVTNFTVVVEESATSTGVFTTIPGMTTTINAAGQYPLQGLRTLRWARVRVSAVVGSAPAILISADIICQARFMPQSGGFSISPAQ